MALVNYESKVKLKEFDSTIYLDRGASRFKEFAWYITKMVFFLTAFPVPSSFKCFLLRLFGAKVGQRIVIKPRVNVHMPWKLTLGDDVWIGEEVFILNFEAVTIGSNCCLSQRSFLCGGNHDYRTPSFPYRNGPITIKDGVWIGACVFVGPNVLVDIDSVITAGSYVTSNLGPNGIYRGNPAVRVGDRWKA